MAHRTELLHVAGVAAQELGRRPDARERDLTLDGPHRLPPRKHVEESRLAAAGRTHLSSTHHPGSAQIGNLCSRPTRGAFLTSSGKDSIR